MCLGGKKVGKAFSAQELGSERDRETVLLVERTGE